MDQTDDLWRDAQESSAREEMAEEIHLSQLRRCSLGMVAWRKPVSILAVMISLSIRPSWRRVRRRREMQETKFMMVALSFAIWVSQVQSRLRWAPRYRIDVEGDASVRGRPEVGQRRDWSEVRGEPSECRPVIWVLVVLRVRLWHAMNSAVQSFMVERSLRLFEMMAVSSQ